MNIYFYSVKSGIFRLVILFNFVNLVKLETRKVNFEFSGWLFFRSILIKINKAV